MLLALFLVGSPAAALEAGDTPPPIDMADQHGKEVDLDALKGKVVVIDFWASWCAPCKHAMPFLQALHEKYAERGLAIVGVNIDRSKKKMDRFLQASPVTFRIVHDPKLAIPQRYELSTMPTSYFTGRDGKVRYAHEGFRKEDAVGMEAKIKALLAEGGG